MAPLDARVAPIQSVMVRPNAATADPPAVQFASKLAWTWSSLYEAWAVFKTTLDRLQVNHRGKYSVERLLALHAYTQRTSTVRAVAVCILTPLPALVISLLLEWIPLAPPSDGWKENGFFWLRLTLSSAIMVFFSGVYVKYLAKDSLQLASWRLAVVSILSATAYVATAAGVASVWTFPIPFLSTIGGVPFVVYEFALIALVLDVRSILAIDNVKKHFAAFNNMSTDILMLLWIYPVFNVAFRSLHGTSQLMFLLVLPLFKFVWKNLMYSNLAAVEDLIPETMIFSVELFNALYLTNCMQSSGSLLTTMAILALDWIQFALHMYRLHRRSSAVQQELQFLRSASRGSQPDDLLTSVQRILQDPGQLKDSIFEAIRVRGSVLTYNLCPRDLTTVETLARRASQTSSAHHYRLRRQSNRSAAKLGKQSLTQSAITTGAEKPPRGEVVTQTLMLLFDCEFLVLGEYIECSIPVIYAVYLPILHQMPNCAYFAHARSLSDSDLVRAMVNIAVFSGLELVSLVLLHLWLRHRFGFSAVHLLAFVLEEQVVFVQSKLIILMIFALQFTIAHLGADLTFRFAWLKNPKVIWWMDN